MNQIPLLFLGDSPAIPGGLSRIGRDLALIASSMDEFRIGFLGRGGLPSSKLPWMQYTFPEYEQWGEIHLKDVWNDFAGDEYGIVMSIWDPSRLMWLGNPVGMKDEEWLRNPPFKKWGYFPVDATGPNDKLTITSAAALQGFDRVLAYTIDGSRVLSNTTGQNVPFIYHGLQTKVFKPRDSEAVRNGLGVKKGTKLIGIVMTNQERKDWGLTFSVMALLREYYKDIMFWCKIDSINRYWDFRNLSVDFGVSDVVDIDTSYKTDENMSYMYSACDLTLLPSLGEGFGYPIVESLACGTPVIHGNYAGGAELIPRKEWLVRPSAFRYETRHNCLRPVYNASDWFQVIIDALEKPKDSEFCAASVDFLSWDTLKPEWKTWFAEGVK